MVITNKIEAAMDVMCKIDQFRYLSNINNISLLLDFGQNYSQEPLSLFKKTVFQSSIIKF